MLAVLQYLEGSDEEISTAAVLRNVGSARQTVTNLRSIGVSRVGVRV
jgi:hypothetical protein